MHSPGDDSLQARLGYIECTDMGQAFKLGRYAIHFHMIGEVHKSYVRGVSVHESYNRAFTIHGTNYLRIEKNVAYKVKGHTVFIEDAIETSNHLTDNLIMNTQRSWSLLNTDQSPACFWITHPNNNFIGNHCGGSERYAYWYDLQDNAMGPSADTNVCPKNDRVGVFRDNHAHSCGRYGLRIFHNMVPRKFPCKPIEYDPSDAKKSDPWWKNPPITATFNGLVSWKNRRAGAIAEKLGDVRFKNFKIADSGMAGIEVSVTNFFGDNMAQIDGALIVGRTSNNIAGGYLDQRDAHGIMTPRSENFVVKNVKFYNFNFGTGHTAALSSCSHCMHGVDTDSGARTVTFEKLFFDDATVPRRIRFGTPYKAIFHDLDGTLTGKGAGSWATFHYKHHEQKGCDWSSETLAKWNGVICDNSVQIRRVAFSEA